MGKKPKKELMRLGLDEQSGRILTDPRGRMTGRGGYACRGCLADLRLDKRVRRAFRHRANQLCVVPDFQ
jgi:predicted RNA-binding protein YlxR (DUF448 family)